jgi:hypothetical protein
VPVAYDPSNYINGVDQRTVAQQRKDEKADTKKSAAKLKEGMRKRILNVKTKSPSATDVQSGKVSGAVKLNKSKTTSKETKVAAKKLTGPEAIKAIQKRTSPAGVKKAEMDAKKAIAKKYPGLTKKSK